MHWLHILLCKNTIFKAQKQTSHSHIFKYTQTIRQSNPPPLHFFFIYPESVVIQVNWSALTKRHKACHLTNILSINVSTFLHCRESINMMVSGSLPIQTSIKWLSNALQMTYSFFSFLSLSNLVLLLCKWTPLKKTTSEAVGFIFPYEWTLRKDHPSFKTFSWNIPSCFM